MLTKSSRPQSRWNQKTNDWDSWNITLLLHCQPVAELCSWADHTSCDPVPHTVFKNPPKWVQVFEHELPVFLTWACSKPHTFLLHDPGVSRLVLLGISERNKFGSMKIRPRPKETVDICIHITDSFCCTPETNTISITQYHKQVYSNKCFLNIRD